jgi:hypothetical protein
MGANDNNGDIKATFDKLIANLHTQFNDFKGQFNSINNCSTMIEQHGGPEEATATTDRAERERKAIATKLEVDTKKPWRMQAAPSSSNKRRHRRHLQSLRLSMT